MMKYDDLRNWISEEEWKKFAMKKVKEEPEVTEINIERIKAVLENENEKNLTVYRCPKCGAEVYTWNGTSICGECMVLMEKAIEIPLGIIVSMLGDL